MELPLTPSARPGGPRGGLRGPYGPEALTGRLLTGRRRLRDEPSYAYGTSLLTGRRRWDEPPYGPEAAALTGRASLRDGVLITGGAYGTSLLTGRRRLRDEPPYGRKRFRPYGTSLLARRHSRTSFLTLTGRVPHGPEALTVTSLYTGRPLTARPRRAPKALRDQPPFAGPTPRFYGTTHFGTKLLPF